MCFSPRRSKQESKSGANSTSDFLFAHLVFRAFAPAAVVMSRRQTPPLGLVSLLLLVAALLPSMIPGNDSQALVRVKKQRKGGISFLFFPFSFFPACLPSKKARGLLFSLNPDPRPPPAPQKKRAKNAADHGPFPLPRRPGTPHGHLLCWRFVLLATLLEGPKPSGSPPFPCCRQQRAEARAEARRRPRRRRRKRDRSFGFPCPLPFKRNLADERDSCSK